LELLPDAECEVEISTDDFIGYIDRLVYLFTDEAGIEHYEIWDYKYSNNIDHYLESAQLHLYKYYFEKTHPNTVVDTLKYVFIPKVNIRQKLKAKPPETIQEFRVRLLEHLKCVEPQIKEVKFDETMVTRFQECCQRLETVKKFPKNPTKLCNWCQFQQYCESDGEIDYMIVQNGQQLADYANLVLFEIDKEKHDIKLIKSFCEEHNSIFIGMSSYEYISNYGMIACTIETGMTALQFAYLLYKSGLVETASCTSLAVVEPA
jgi:hypothetical protein